MSRVSKGIRLTISVHPIWVLLIADLFGIFSEISARDFEPKFNPFPVFPVHPHSATMKADDLLDEVQSYTRTFPGFKFRVLLPGGYLGLFDCSQ